MPVPEWGGSAFLAVSSKDLLRSRHDFGGVSSYEYICALGDSDWALGVLTQGQARDSEGRGFFLDTPGVGQSQRSFAEQAEKIEISQRRNEAELRVVLDPALGEPLLSARMYGEHYGHLLCNRIDSAEELGEFIRRIDV